MSACAYPPPARGEFRVDVRNLSPVQREFLATAVAVFTDPALADARRLLERGHMALGIESGEVTWCNGPGGGQ